MHDYFSPACGLGPLCAFCHNLVRGTSTTTASSLPGANPNRTRPNPALIKVTNPIYGGADLSVPQWVVTGTPIDDHAYDSVPDWVQTKSRDVFANATGDASDVLSTIAYYTIRDLGADVEGQLDSSTPSSQSNILINPFNVEMRLDAELTSACGHLSGNTFTRTVLHEGRHAYQFALASIPGNDNDGDLLVNNVPIAPTNVIVDSTDARDVCNVTAGFTIESRSYHGDSVRDSFSAPDYAQFAIEKDAYDFASNH
jgi:hypothetical protein